MHTSTDWDLIKSELPRIRQESERLRISAPLVTMLIAAEDHRYGIHPGVDPISLCRAAWRSMFYGRREGGSTIAMQLVRVITGRYEKTLSRKISEIFLAVRLTKAVNSAELPRLYLTVAYFGWRMNGLAQAAQRLCINLSSVSEMEAANIVARLKYPEPRRLDEERRAKIRDRTTYILRRSNGSLKANRVPQLKLSENNGSF